MALPMKEGRYRAKAISAEWVEGKTAPQLFVAFEIRDPAFPGERFNNYFNFTGGAFKYSMQNLRTMGLKHDNLDDRLTIADLPNEVDLVIAPEEYQGKTKLRLNFVNDPNFTGGAKKADPSKLRSFAEQAKAQIKFLENRDAENELGPPPPGALGNEPPPHTDEDVPF
jgi:hypothetical protein